MSARVRVLYVGDVVASKPALLTPLFGENYVRVVSVTDPAYLLERPRISQAFVVGRYDCYENRRDGGKDD